MPSTQIRAHAPQVGRANRSFKLRPVALGCAAVLLSASELAMAQQASQEVVVTGIRRAVESAIAAKKEADSIVETVTSEDLGKLPDPSIAESMSRLPGVAAQRNKGTGKAESISVRGMSPDFNGGLLNGREVASAGDSRAVNFDLYPAELMNQVMVYKSPHAGLLGQGLSSTIDLRTIRPLTSPGRQVMVNTRKLRTGIDNGVADGEGTGERHSLSYVDQFFGRTLGVALGYAKFRENGAAQPAINTWGGWTPTVDYNGQQVGVPGGFGRDIERTTHNREALMAVLQWKPNKNFETTVDFIQSEGRSAYQKRGIEGHIGATTDANNNYRGIPVLSNATISNGIATSGTFNNFKGVVRNHNEATEDELKAWGINASLKDVAGWTLTGDASNSSVTKEGSRLETTAGLTGNSNPTLKDSTGRVYPVTPGATGTISWTGFNGSNHGAVVYTSSTNFADRNVVKLTDVVGWGGGPLTPQAGYVAAPKVTDDIDTFRVSAKRDLSWGHIAGVEFGINATKREKTASTREGYLVINGATDGFAGANIPGTSTVVTPGGIAVATWDPTPAAIGTVYSLRSNLYGTVINRNWSVKEDVTTSFVKADLDGTLFGLAYTGNVGVQVVNTDQRSTGFVNDSGRCTGGNPASCTSLSGGKSYTDLLPSINLAANLGNDMIGRFALGRALARPKMSDMRASIDPPALPQAQLQQVLRASGGNPEVEPFRANALDLSVEKYFGNKGYVALAGFYKDLRSYVLTLPQAGYDFRGVVSSSTVLPPGGSTLGILTRPMNGQGGSISGFELAVNLPLSMLAKPLDGFGVQINHSDTSSNIPIDTVALGFTGAGTVTLPLPGLSRKVTNLRFYYEKHGLQVAVASRSRSDFLGEITDYKDDKEWAYIRGETVVDLQLGYSFPDNSYLKGLSLTLQANNITNEKFRRYTTDRNNTTDVNFGKTYMFGANYKF